MTAKRNGASPDKRRKYDEAFMAVALRLAGESRSTQAAVRQLGISPMLLYRWQQAQLVAEVGSEEVARDPVNPGTRGVRLIVFRIAYKFGVEVRPGCYQFCRTKSATAACFARIG